MFSCTSSIFSVYASRSLLGSAILKTCNCEPHCGPLPCTEGMLEVHGDPSFHVEHCFFPPLPIKVVNSSPRLDCPHLDACMAKYQPWTVQTECRDLFWKHQDSFTHCLLCSTELTPCNFIHNLKMKFKLKHLTIWDAAMLHTLQWLRCKGKQQNFYRLN